MRRIFALPVLLTILAGLTACPDHDASLDDALRQYVAQREAEAQAACKCYHLFVNLSGFDLGMFTSEEECLEVLLPAPEDDAVNCMKSVLDSSSYDTEESVDVVKCYTETRAKKADCYAENAGECSKSACSSGIETLDKCQGKLTDEEVEAFYWCAVR